MRHLWDRVRRVAIASLLLTMAAPLATSFAAPPPASSPSLNRLDPVIQRARRSVVRVVALHPERPAQDGSPARGRPRAHVASGVAIDSDGHLLTTANAVAGCISIRVRTSDGREVSASLLGLDPATDLALIRIPGGIVPPLPMAPAAGVRIGAPIVTVAQSYGALPTQDVGRITWRYHEPLRSLIQMTNVIYPGNPGGAAVDEQGRLLGVLIGGLGEVHAAADSSLAKTAAGRGGTFAVPADDLRFLVEEMLRYGGVRRGFLGVSIRQGLVNDPEHPGVPAAIGVAVSDVIAGGPAWQAGMRAGDLVVAVDGVPVDSPEDLMGRISAQRPGATPELLWIRAEKEYRSHVRLGATPDSVIAATLETSLPASRGSREDIEAEVQKLHRELDRLSAPSGRGSR